MFPFGPIGLKTIVNRGTLKMALSKLAILERKPCQPQVRRLGSTVSSVTTLWHKFLQVKFFINEAAILKLVFNRLPNLEFPIAKLAKKHA